MTFLVVGEFYSSNLGDPLLCETVVSVIRGSYPTAKIIPFDLSGKISMTEKYEIHSKSLPPWFHRKLKVFPAYRKYYNKKKQEDKYSFITEPLKQIKKKNKIDLVVFAGGEMFMDFFVNKIQIIVGFFEKTPIIFHACGMYYLSNDAKRIFYQIVRSANVKSVSVRDSYNRFVEYFGSEKISNTYDTALLCSLYSLPSQKKNDLGIGVIDREEFFSFQVSFIKEIQKSNINWQLFTNGSQSDYNAALRILKQIGIHESETGEYLHSRPTSAKELIQEVTTYNRIVAFRLHCQIIAASFGIASYGFVWDDKVKEFYDKLSIDNYSYPNSDIDINIILNKLALSKNNISELAVDLGNHSRNTLLRAINDACK